jgi:alpha-L-rhamnosidase
LGSRVYYDIEGIFSNLLVTDANAGTPLSSPLTDPSILDAFAAGTTLIIDGAKRDRYVWSVDLAISAPTIYYTSGASDVVSGSLRLRSSGQVPG